MLDKTEGKSTGKAFPPKAAGEKESGNTHKGLNNKGRKGKGGKRDSINRGGQSLKLHSSVPSWTQCPE